MDPMEMPYCFIPTKHYHQKRRIFGDFKNGVFKGAKEDKGEAEGKVAKDWDHVIYTVGKFGLDSTMEDKVAFVFTNKAPWKIFPEEFHLKGTDALKRLTKKGNGTTRTLCFQLNRDYLGTINGRNIDHPSAVSISFSQCPF